MATFTVQTLPDDRGTVLVPKAEEDLSILDGRLTGGHLPCPPTAGAGAWSPRYEPVTPGRRRHSWP